jgi:hypothetical protein
LTAGALLAAPALARVDPGATVTAGGSAAGAAATATGTQATASSNNNGVFVGVGIGVAVLVLAGVTLLVTRRRRTERHLVAVPAEQGVRAIPPARSIDDAERRDKAA